MINPDMLTDSAPVILTGRGGSGTRLLSQLALPLGVFLGNDLNKSSDSTEWVADLYELALETVTIGIAAGSARDLYWRQRLRERAAAILDKAGRSSDSVWGWKLPETMLVLPQVLRTFAKSRVIHLVRHPISSALRRTHVTSRASNPVGAAVLKAAYALLGRDIAMMAHDAPYLHNAITWRFQVEQAVTVLVAHNPARTLQMRYEDLCASPADGRERLSRFLGLPSAADTCLPLIDAGRVGEDAPDPAHAEQVWRICADVAHTLGYGQT